MSDGSSAQAIVIGAGLAGLACAADLSAAGLAVRVLEASAAAGGYPPPGRVAAQSR